MAKFRVFTPIALLPLVALVLVACDGDKPENQFPAVLMSANELAEVHKAEGLPFYTSPAELRKRSLEVPFPIIGDAGRNRELNGIFDEVFSRRLTGKGTPLCELYGEDCLAITYFDDSQRIHRRQADRGYSLTVGGQLELEGFLELESLVAESNGRTRPGSDARLDYRGKFERHKYFNPRKLAEADWKRLKPEWERLLSSDGANAEVFSRAFLKSSRAFALLPEMHKEAARLARPGAVRAIERISEKALFLTLDALYENAHYEVATYPYKREDDRAAFHPTLLNPSTLARHLAPLGRWPQVKHLDTALRERLAGGDPKSVLLHKTPEGGYWVRGGSGSERRDERGPKLPVLYLDFNLPFYENVFLLYHELWHLAWDHSALAEKRTAELVDIIRSGTIEDIRSAFLRTTSENELIAFDQQNRLFHATELLATSWEGKHLYTAKGWHDSYFGFRSNYDRLGSYEIRGGVPEGLYRLEFGPIGLIPAGVAKLFRLVFEGAQSIVRGPEDPNYWSERLKNHRQFFEDSYFCRRTEIDLVSIETAVRMSELKFVDRKPPVLSCADLLKAAQALETVRCDGRQWLSSLPFEYEVADDGSAACQALKALPSGFLWLGGGGGNGGTHGGFDFVAKKPQGRDK